MAGQGVSFDLSLQPFGGLSVTGRMLQRNTGAAAGLLSRHPTPS